MDCKSNVQLCIVILFLSTVIDTSWAATVAVDINIPRVKKGQDVTIRCIVRGKDPSSFIYWRKIQGSIETQIGTNSLINQKFLDTGRYSADSREEGDTITFFIKITGVQDQDGGRYGCHIPTQEDTKTYKELIVLAAPTSIRLFSLEAKSDISKAVEYTNGQRVRSYDGESRYFRCMVGPAHPAPAVAISYAGHDKTSLFKRDEKQLVIGDEVVDRGLIRLATQVNLTTDSAPIEITYEANTQTMTCSASVPETKEVAISIQFVLQFAPRFTCDHVVRAGLYYKNISIACSVRADPPLHLAHTKWFWKRNEADNVTLSTGQATGRYTAKMIKGQLEDEYIVMLSIDHTTPQVFRRYWLTVSNALGENTKEFLLEKDGTAPVKSAAGRTSGSLVTLIALLSFVLRHHS